MIKCFMPLPNFKFDPRRVLQEFIHWAKLEERTAKLQSESFSFTTIRECINETDYNFERFSGVSAWDASGVRRTKEGAVDSDIVHWPSILQNSYIKEIGENIASFLEIPLYRARGSLFRTGDADYTYPAHRDRHTPFRVHLALATTPNTKWLFNNTVDVSIHQPTDGVPVLINTGSVQHSLLIPANTTRIHFWYQFYEPIKPDILDKLSGISC
jgi:hypothetical protein